STTISIVAIVADTILEQQPLTFVSTGALCLAAALWWRRIEIAGGGALLIVIGATTAGHGSGASALFAVALAAVIAATRLASPIRRVALLTSVAATAGGWIELALFSEWDRGQSVQATALAGGLLSVVVAAAGRIRRIEMD